MCSPTDLHTPSFRGIVFRTKQLYLILIARNMIGIMTWSLEVRVFGAKAISRAICQCQCLNFCFSKFGSLITFLLNLGILFVMPNCITFFLYKKKKQIYSNKSLRHSVKRTSITIIATKI